MLAYCLKKAFLPKKGRPFIETALIGSLCFLHTCRMPSDSSLSGKAEAHTETKSIACVLDKRDRRFQRGDK